MENENIYFHGNRPEMAFMIPSDVHKVLEIGCGKGNFKTHFPDSVEYWGVEPNAEARAEAEQHFHIGLTQRRPKASVTARANNH